MAALSLTADAFVDAFSRHGRTLWVIAAAWVGPEEAADLVQEAARVAWQKRAACSAGSDARAWLAQIVRHLGANWRRRRLPATQAPDTFDQLVERPRGVELRLLGGFDADHAELPDDLAKALGGLSDVARACLLLQVLQGLSFAEIGALLDLPENTAASHARRARMQLRETLTGRAAATKPARELS